MPSSTLNVYNKDGSTLVGSGNADLSYKVTDTGIVDMVDGSYINVAFSNSNVIGYASSPNSTIPEFHIGSTNFGFGPVGVYNIYEVEGDKYSITTSIPSITINCKDKTMQKDLQITFNGAAGTNANITINVMTYNVNVGGVGVYYSIDGGNEFIPIEGVEIINLENVSTIMFKYEGYGGGGVPGIGSYCHVGTEERGKNIINAGDSEYYDTIITPKILPNDGDTIYVEMEYS